MGDFKERAGEKEEHQHVGPKKKRGCRNKSPYQLSISHGGKTRDIEKLTGGGENGPSKKEYLKSLRQSGGKNVDAGGTTKGKGIRRKDDLKEGRKRVKVVEMSGGRSTRSLWD